MGATSTSEVPRPLSFTAALISSRASALMATMTTSFSVDPFDEFVVPNHLGERERNVLLGLEGDELLEVVVLKRRKLDEAGEDSLSGNGVARLGSTDLEAPAELSDRDSGLRDAGCVQCGIRDDGL